MKIASMVVDHLEHFDYKVEYVSNRLTSFDMVIWFGADEHQCEMLEAKKNYCKHPNVSVVNLDHKIKNGNDFAIMQDMSFEHIKNNYDYSICAFQSADELLTDYGIKAVDEWIANSDQEFAVFYAMSNKMFCETYVAPLVFQIFRRGVEYRTNNGLSDNIRYCNGKAITDNNYYTNLGYSDQEDSNYIIDLGYINAEACYNKVRNWSRLCYGDGHTPKLLGLYDLEDKTEFIKFFIERHRGEFHGATDHKVTPVLYQGEYKRLIDDLNIKADYDFTVELIKTLTP